jgi:hypothetical protein
MERRKHSRFPCGGDARVSPVGAQPLTEWSASVHDLSRQGISLTSERRFEPRSLLLVRWQPGAEASSQYFISRVARVAAQRNQQWLLGCVFLHKLSLEELAVLMLELRARKRSGTSHLLIRKATDEERAANEQEVQRVVARLRRRNPDENHDS